MPLHSSLPAPTRDQLRRHDAIREDGCLLCQLKGLGHTLPQIHHLLLGGRKISHDHVLGLCDWHHQAIKPADWKYGAMVDRYGPSLAHGSYVFHEHWGADQYLLELQSERVGMDAPAWPSSKILPRAA